MNKTNRRHFFKQVALGGLGAAGLSLGTSFHAEGASKSKNNLLSVNSKRSAGFNMCGFAASKLAMWVRFPSPAPFFRELSH